MKPYYQDDFCTIYHGDCREILPEIGPIDVLLTDPPYAPNGDTPESDSRAGIAIGLNMAARLVKPDGTAFVFSTCSAKGIDFIRESMKPMRLKRLMPWTKECSLSRVGGPWRWDTVQIHVYGRSVWGGPRLPGYFHSRSKPDAQKVHPVALPDGMGEHWLLAPFEPGRVVLDPFCGSGALIHGCGRLGHRAIGIDISEEHCETAVRRLQQETIVLPSPVPSNGSASPQESMGI